MPNLFCRGTRIPFKTFIITGYIIFLGGAVCGVRFNGNKLKRGFLKVDVDKENFTWEYGNILIIPGNRRIENIDLYTNQY